MTDKKRDIASTGGNSARTRGLRPWKKGQSGNPKGRPKLSPELKAALDELEPLALDVLRHHMEKRPSSPEAIQAARYVLNRKYGNPPESVKISQGDQPTRLILKYMPPVKREG
jgi:hypothetical protein